MKTKALLGILAVLALNLSLQAQNVSTLISSNIYDPYGIAVDEANSFYITDAASNRVVKYVPQTGVMTILSGSGEPGYLDGIGVQARFSNPKGIVYSKDRGGLVVADTDNHAIRFIRASDGMVSTLAGIQIVENGTTVGKASSLGAAPGTTVAATNAGFRYPLGLAYDPSNGSIYIADSVNGAIRVLDTNNFVTTLANGFSQPAGVAIGINGQLWVADTLHNSVKLLEKNASGAWVVTLVAGSSANSAGAVDSLYASYARFNAPRAVLWVGGNTGLMVADSGNNVLRNVYFNTTMNGWAVGTLAGTAGSAGAVDGPFSTAKFNGPVNFGYDADNLSFLVVDSSGKSIRQLQFSPPQPTIPAPQIGYALLTEDKDGLIKWVFYPATQAVFNDESQVSLVIRAAATGVETLFSDGQTPPLVFDGSTIPEPFNNAQPWLYPFDSSDPLPPPSLRSQFSLISDVTVKARSSATGRRASEIVSARFIFKTASPSISGDNAASFRVQSATPNAKLFYTFGYGGYANIPDPTNGFGPRNFPETGGKDTALGVVLTAAGPSLMSFTGLTNNLYVKVRAFRNGYQDSEVTPQMFNFTNYSANKITFGFESGECSSEFVAAAGQQFYAPITLNLLPSQKMYSLQFNMKIGSLPYSLQPERISPAVDAGSMDFETLLFKPDPARPGFIVPIPPSFYYADQAPPYDPNPLDFANLTEHLLYVGWLESGSPSSTNLYPSGSQDLITYSKAHDTQFLSSNQKVIVGSFNFQIPTNSVMGDLYRIKLGRASATSDGVSADVVVDMPTNGAFGQGAINALKNVTVGEKHYLVGDSTPFRWYNAGDYGDGYLLNNDVLQIFRSASYRWNAPPQGSDFFDSMDTCCRPPDVTNVYTWPANIVVLDQTLTTNLTINTDYYVIRTNIQFTTNIQTEVVRQSTEVVASTITTNYILPIYTNYFTTTNGLVYSNFSTITATVSEPSQYTNIIVRRDVQNNVYRYVTNGSDFNYREVFQTNMSSSVTHTNPLSISRPVYVRNNTPPTATTVNTQDGMYSLRLAATNVFGGASVFENEMFTDSFGTNLVMNYASANISFLVRGFKTFSSLGSLKVILETTNGASLNLAGGVAGIVQRSGNRLALTSGSGTVDQNTGVDLEADQGWHSVTIQYYSGSPASLYLYVDGILKASSTFASGGSLCHIAFECDPSAVVDLDRIFIQGWNIYNRIETFGTDFETGLGSLWPYFKVSGTWQIGNVPFGAELANLNNNMVFGDGRLQLNDIFVAFHRAMDPTLSWYERFWSNGKRHAITVPNTFRGIPDYPDSPAMITTAASSLLPPKVAFKIPEVVGTPGQVVDVPITAEVSGAYPMRVMLLNLTVKPLDAAPALTSPVEFRNSLLGPPSLTTNEGLGNISMVWLNHQVSGLSGTNILGYLRFTVPANAPSPTAYAIVFGDGVAGSPDGINLFPMTQQTGLLILGDCTRSSLGDGIPDSWRLKNFGSVSNILSHAMADADGDGVPNWMEFKAGTNPMDAASKLALTLKADQFKSLAGANRQHLFTLAWPTVDQVNYVLEGSPELLGTNWTVLKSNILGNGQMKYFSDTSANTGIQFYRVRVAE